MTTCGPCNDRAKWYNNQTHLPCAIPFCSDLRQRGVAYCYAHNKAVDKFGAVATRADVRGELISNLRAMERRNGHQHPGVVYVWSFADAGIVKVGHSVDSAMARRDYAWEWVCRWTGKLWQYPILEVELKVAEPAALERYVCERLFTQTSVRPLFRREFFPIASLPTIKQILCPTDLLI
jgi:hypothetical protein